MNLIFKYCYLMPFWSYTYRTIWPLNNNQFYKSTSKLECLFSFDSKMYMFCESNYYEHILTLIMNICTSYITLVTSQKLNMNIQITTRNLATSQWQISSFNRLIYFHLNNCAIPYKYAYKLHTHFYEKSPSKHQLMNRYIVFL